MQAIHDEMQDRKQAAGRQIKIGDKGNQILILSKKKKASGSIFSRFIPNGLKVKTESEGDKNLLVTRRTCVLKRPVPGATVPYVESRSAQPLTVANKSTRVVQTVIIPADRLLSTSSPSSQTIQQ